MAAQIDHDGSEWDVTALGGAAGENAAQYATPSPV